MMGTEFHSFYSLSRNIRHLFVIHMPFLCIANRTAYFAGSTRQNEVWDSISSQCKRRNAIVKKINELLDALEKQ
jgi:hypothetical protein